MDDDVAGNVCQARPVVHRKDVLLVAQETSVCHVEDDVAGIITSPCLVVDGGDVLEVRGELLGLLAVGEHPGLDRRLRGGDAPRGLRPGAYTCSLLSST